MRGGSGKRRRRGSSPAVTIAPNGASIPLTSDRTTARIVVAEDSLLVRTGIVRLLRDAFDVVGEASSARELLDLVEREQPDAALIDIRLPPTHSDEGLRAAAEIRRRFPSVALLVVSQYVEAEYALRLLSGEERQVGYLLKDRILEPRQLTDAITRIVEGGVVVDPALVTQLLDRPRLGEPLGDLTPRERDVLALMAEGLTDRGIAERLFVTPKTVETHIRHIFGKLSLPETALDNKRVHAVLTYLRA
jgi:DNA-binding NarL/FixJ family response regulator